MSLKGKAKTTELFTNGDSVISPKTYDELRNDQREHFKRLPGSFITEQYLEDDKGKKQGFGRIFRYRVIDANRPEFQNTGEEEVLTTEGLKILRYVSDEGFYKDNKKDGVWLTGLRGAIVGYITFKDGVENGLAKFKDGEYCLFQNGKIIKNDRQLRKEWMETVEGLKFEKELDKPARSTTLKQVLAAASKSEKKSILKEFHSKESPAGNKRRTALKFDR